MTVYNPILKEKIGVDFEFKSSFVSYLQDTLENDIVSTYDTINNNPAIRQTAVDRVRLTTPAMRFEYKAGAYNALRLINETLMSSPEVSNEDKNNLSNLIALVNRYVGLEGEDGYHFTIAVYKVAEAITGALAEL